MRQMNYKWQWPTALTLSAVVLGLALSTHAAESEAQWTENVQEAMSQAEKQDKDLLMDFTGSDWCGWCHRLHDEVFSQPAFTDNAPEDFVLVKLDFPRGRILPDEIREQNDKWQRKLQIEGYPTIILADAQGRPYARTGYQPGGAEQYMAMLEQMQQQREQRDEALAAAEQAEGLDKAWQLDRAMQAVGLEMAVLAYPQVVEQIVELDADNEAGLKATYAEALQQNQLREVLMSTMQLIQQGEAQQALDKLDQMLEGDLDGEQRQQLLAVKTEVYLHQGERDKAREAIDQAIAAAPESPMATHLKQAREAHLSE